MQLLQGNLKLSLAFNNTLIKSAFTGFCDFKVKIKWEVCMFIYS